MIAVPFASGCEVSPARTKLRYEGDALPNAGCEPEPENAGCEPEPENAGCEPEPENPGCEPEPENAGCEAPPNGPLGAD